MDGSAIRRRADPNPPEQVPDNKIRRPNPSNVAVPAQNPEESSTMSLGEKLVNMWKAGANFSPVFTQENLESVKLKEIQEKCLGMEKINSELQQWLMHSEEKVVKLNSELKNQDSQKRRIVEKMNTFYEYMQQITETINYVTESLDDCREHKDRLTYEYNEVIKKVYSDNQNLQAEVQQLVNEKQENAAMLQRVTQSEAELGQLREHHQVLQVEVEGYRRKFSEFGENERKLQKKIGQLEICLTEEKRKFEQTVAADREKDNQMRKSCQAEVQRLQKEIKQAKEMYSNLEDEKNNVFRTLAEKESEIKKMRDTCNNYKLKITELEAQLSEKILSCQRLNDEKLKIEQEIEEKNKQITQLSEDFDAVKIDLLAKSTQLSTIDARKLSLEQEAEFRKQIEALQQKLTDKTSEILKFQGDYEKLLVKINDERAEMENLKTELSRKNALLQDAVKMNEELDMKMSTICSTKQYEVDDLKCQLDSTKQEIQMVIHEKDSLCQEWKLKYEELERNYQNDIKKHKEKIDKITSDLRSLNSARQELEKIKERYLAEKEKTVQMLNKTEQQLQKKSNSDLQSKEKLQKSQKDLKAAEKRAQEFEKKYHDADSEGKQQIAQLQRDLKTAEERAQEFKQKYYDTDGHLNEKLRQLQRNLEAAERRAQESAEKHYGSLTHVNETMEQMRKSSEAAERRARELEAKYQSTQALLEDAEKRAKEFEMKYRNLENQGDELQRKMAELANALQEPQILSPSSWKKPTQSKKVTIRAEQILPSGTVKTKLMPPPNTPKTPKVPKTPKQSPKASKSPLLTSKSSPRSPATPITPSPVSTPRSTVTPTTPDTPPPKLSPASTQETSPLHLPLPKSPVTSTPWFPPGNIEKRPDEPDSSAMDIEDGLSMTMNEVIYSLKHDSPGVLFDTTSPRSTSRSASPNALRSTVGGTPTTRKFFKSRTQK